MPFEVGSHDNKLQTSLKYQPLEVGIVASLPIETPGEKRGYGIKGKGSVQKEFNYGYGYEELGWRKPFMGKSEVMVGGICLMNKK